MSKRVLSVCLLLPLMFGALPALGQPPSAESSDARDEEEEGAEGRGAKKGKIKPYDEVITEDAESDEGLFTVHRDGDKVFYEIPKSELGTELLWVTRVSRTSDGLGNGGRKLGSRVVTWERQGKRVLLREKHYDVVADPELPVAQAVANSNTSTVLRAFDILTFGGAGAEASMESSEADSEAETEAEADGEKKEKKPAPTDGDPVIDVTSLFTKEVAELSAKAAIGADRFAADRAFVEHVASYPRNIEVRASHTYVKNPERNGGRGGTPQRRSFRPQMSPGSATLEMAYSMVKLPEDPMMPRLHDPRVGYFRVTQTDYGRDEHRAQERSYITRWRLEKKDPNAKVSDPVQPIVYWVDPATPKKWVPYVKQGIEDWQPAFEAAGFRNAIVAREAPSPAEDPEWSPEDARYSVVRWLASEIENASGPHVNDPRTGEILESDIQYYHNIQNLLRSWYFVQVGPLDPRVHSLPMPDDLMGEMLRYVVAHEVGHTLGFPHNMKASSNYPFDKLRDPEYLKDWSHTPTLMDYSRFNYIVQPEDGVDPALLFPIVGPYDKWATKWGYAPIDGANTPDDERATLDAWAREQDDKPWLRFSTEGVFGVDPGEMTEAVGDADAVAATRLGVKNIKRVIDLILPATDWAGSDWDHAAELYERALGQWRREMNHVAWIIGGMDTRQVHRGQEGMRFNPIPRARQEDALRFLQTEAFATPEYLVPEQILRRIEPAGALERIRGLQTSVLRSLLQESRLERLVEQEAFDPVTAYPAVAFLGDLRDGIFSEWASRNPEVDAYRRGLQQAFVEVVGTRVQEMDAGHDARALLRGQLSDLRRQIAATLPRTDDLATRYHLEDLRDQIQRILDPRFSPSSSTPQRGFAALELIDPFDPSADLFCWTPDRLEQLSPRLEGN